MAALEADHARLNNVAAPLSKEAKRARLHSYGREPYRSDRAKVDMIKKLKEQGFPEHASRSAFQRARRAECSQEKSFGKIVQPLHLPQFSGDPFEIYIQHPLAMLEFCSDTCVPFHDCISARISDIPQTPEDPWNLILYCDEIGVQSLHHDPREVYACY